MWYEGARGQNCKIHGRCYEFQFSVLNGNSDLGPAKNEIRKTTDVQVAGKSFENSNGLALEKQYTWHKNVGRSTLHF